MISAADFAALIFHGKQNKLNEDDNMKKLGYVLMVLLEAAALAGAYIINYFTNKKMGMARWVIYKNQGWERDYPMDTLKTVVMAVLILLTILVFFFFLKKETGSRKAFDIYECCDDLADTALCFLYSDQLQRDHEGLLFSEPSVWDSCGCSDFKDRCGSADVWEEI